MNLNDARKEVFDRIDDEQVYATKLWGEKFDDQNTLNDWTTYINIYLARASTMENTGNAEEQVKALVKAANLAINAAAHVTSGRCTPRHYEGIQSPPGGGKIRGV